MSPRLVTRSGASTRVEVSSISTDGVHLLLGKEELFLSFENFPWFRESPVSSVLHVERPQPHHLHWPKLDIDLDVESIRDPERCPLVSREGPVKPVPRKARVAPTPRRG